MSKIKSEGPFSSLEIESDDSPTWSIKGCLNCKTKDAEIAALKAELAAKELKWQEGKPTQIGWYFVKYFGMRFLFRSELNTIPLEFSHGWAGPLEPPLITENK